MSQIHHCPHTLSITLCMLGNFAVFLLSTDFFQFTIFKNFFQESVSNSVDLDQA